MLKESGVSLFAVWPISLYLAKYTGAPIPCKSGTFILDRNTRLVYIIKSCLLIERHCQRADNLKVYDISLLLMCCHFNQ